MRTRWLVLVAVLSFLGACQNWDLLRPADPADDAGGRSFTRLNAEPQPLTNAVALQRLQEIQAASGQQRLDLIDRFVEDFPQAKMIGEVHRLAGEGYVATGHTDEAADAFERALVLTRTDVLGLPLEIELPLQLAMTQLAAGRREQGLSWLARVSIVDRSPRTEQALHWAFSQFGTGSYEAWVKQLRASEHKRAPEFELPGLLTETVALPADAGTATLVDFWSPT